MITTGPAAPQANLIRAILDDLVRQRRRLRSTAAEAGLLEANRLAIVYWQRELVRTTGGDDTKAA